jgi:hypothetical protein
MRQEVARRPMKRHARNLAIFTVSMVVTHVVCLILFSAVAGLIAGWP